jgi:endonuclease III
LRFISEAALMAEAIEAKAREMYERLVAAYGHQPNVPRREPMHELISTILSHRTTQRNEDIAYRRMIDRFGSWEAIRDAPVEELAEAIAPSNYAEQKAPRIKEVLRRILEERGEASLDFLRDMPLDDALAWLESLPGVGPKTASLVLLFCFARPVLPVDTHVHRVSQRVGLIGPKVDATAAHPLLLALFPRDAQVLYNFHISTLRHGQRVCVWGTPRCSRCVLTEICDYFHSDRPRS